MFSSEQYCSAMKRGVKARFHADFSLLNGRRSVNGRVQRWRSNAKRSSDGSGTGQSAECRVYSRVRASIFLAIMPLHTTYLNR